MMNMKQEERLDIREGVFKNEPNFISRHTNPQTYKDEVDDVFEKFKTNTPRQNVEIKEEMIECEDSIEQCSDVALLIKIEHNYVCEYEYFQNVPLKLEQCSDLLIKVDHDYVHECEYLQNVTLNNKKEPPMNDFYVGINNIKQEPCEFVQPKSESELSTLLTTYCDLPTLKDESTAHISYLDQPSNNKQTKRKWKSLKDVSKKRRRRRYPCPASQNNFPSSKSRLKHIDRHFGEGFVVCDFCGRFMTKMSYVRHQFIHAVKNRSGKVSLQIEGVSDIQTHSIIHSNKKPFKCEICFKRFNHKTSLRTHLIIHSYEKPFKCDICSKEFKLKLCLLRHLIIHINEKTFKCNICFKEFQLNFYLQQHLLTHSNKKQFKCDICSKIFSKKSNLQQHLIVHSNEKPFN